jgi:hypothetical protein
VNRRSAFVVPAFVFVLSLTLWATLPRGGGDKRITGTVLEAKATYCEPKKADGCTGELKLGRAGDGELSIKVPLGTPISSGCETLSLGELPGRRVVVTEANDARGPIALAISTLAGTCG